MCANFKNELFRVEIFSKTRSTHLVANQYFGLIEHHVVPEQPEAVVDGEGREEIHVYEDAHASQRPGIE